MRTTDKEHPSSCVREASDSYFLCYVHISKFLMDITPLIDFRNRLQMDYEVTKKTTLKNGDHLYFCKGDIKEAYKKYKRYDPVIHGKAHPILEIKFS